LSTKLHNTDRTPGNKKPGTQAGLLPITVAPLAGEVVDPDLAIRKRCDNFQLRAGKKNRPSGRLKELGFDQKPR